MNRYIKVLAFAGAMIVAGITASHAEAAGKYGDSILVRGSQGDAVTSLQQDLRVLGYFTYSSNTGFYGDLTEEAVKAFQKDHKLELNGKVGATTGPLIQAEAAKKASQTKDNGKTEIINIAKSLIGVPYAWGGTTPSGFDCSGFITYVYKQKGIQLPRTSYDMYNGGTYVNEAQPGDLVFFSTYAPGASHVGIYLGENKFISATDDGVKIDSFSSSYWGPRYLGAKRY